MENAITLPNRATDGKYAKFTWHIKVLDIVYKAGILAGYVLIALLILLSVKQFLAYTDENKVQLQSPFQNFIKIEPRSLNQAL